MSIASKIKAREWVSNVDDERGIGNSIIVTLKDGICFECEPGCGVRGFDTMADAERETRVSNVYEEIKGEV